IPFGKSNLPFASGNPLGMSSLPSLLNLGASLPRYGDATDHSRPLASSRSTGFSGLPMARYLPSGEKVIGFTQGAPLSNSARRRPVPASQTLAVGSFQSRAPVIKFFPSGENAMC